MRASRESRPSGVTRSDSFSTPLRPLQDIFLTAVDEPGQMPLKLTIDAAATQGSIPFVANAPGFTT